MVLLALAVAALQGAGTAAAQAAPQTSHIAVNECRPTAGGSFCMQAEGVIHRTITPAGDTMATMNLHRCVQSMTATGQLFVSRCERIHRNELVKQGEPEVFHDTSRGVLTIFGFNCEYRTALQVVMGESRHVGLDVECTPA